jgi:dienelactone hydrolase
MFFISCNNENASTDKETDNDSASQSSRKPEIKEETVTYESEGKSYRSFVAYDQNLEGKRPAVIIVHEWWGLTDYPKDRARQLAALGYIALAADMYGDGRTAGNPQEAQQLATPFYTNPQLTKSTLDAALRKLKEFPQADTSKLAAIGYCFGGSVVLNAAKLGADLKGVVSFHGNLAGVPPRKDLLKSKVLVCHGEADKFISEQEINRFKRGMDSIGADYRFKSYPGATHAFTNPDATETGKKFNMPIEYNAAADTASWNDMKSFFGTIFSK